MAKKAIDELIINQNSKVKKEADYLSDFIAYYAFPEDRKVLLKYVGDIHKAIEAIFEYAKGDEK